jgi:hypothetical protein
MDIPASILYNPLNTVSSSVDYSFPVTPARGSWPTWTQGGASGADERLTVADYCQPNVRALPNGYGMSHVRKSRYKFAQRPMILFIAMTASLTVLATFVLLIGSRVQFRRVRRAPSTVNFYTIPTVCGASSFAPQALDPFSTFDNASVAHAESQLVVHCGPCAACSNFNDIKKYVLLR